MIKVKDGYAKLIGTTYKGSPDWVLLSNGGHKPISDFATASGVVTALGTNGNYVTWTKNGTVNNLTVPYATNADKIDGKHESDLFVSQRGKVDVNYIDLTSYTSGNENYKLYDSGIYTVPRSGYSDAYIVFKSRGSTSAVELMTNHKDTARLKLRKTVDNTRVSGPWRELAFTSDIPTVTDYYWADVKISLSSNPKTTPTFLKVNLDGLSLTKSANVLNISNSSGYILIGPQNEHHCHLYTDLPSFYTNKPILIGGKDALHTGNWSSTITKSALGLGNVQNTAFYKRYLNINGNDYAFASTTNSSTSTTIYGPTTAGTSGQVLISSGGTPGWTNLSNITAGVANKLKNLGKHSEVASSTTVPSDLFEGAYYNSGMFMTSNMHDSATPCSFGNIINVLGNGGGLLLLGWEGSYKTGNIYYRSHRDMVNSGGWTPWREVAFTDSNVASATNADKLDGLHKDGFQQAVYTYYPELHSIANTTTLANIIAPNITSDSDNFKFYDTKFYGTASSTSNRAQIAYGYQYDGIHFRRYYDGAWTAWKQLAFKETTLAGYGITDAVKLASFGKNGIDLNELDETGIWNGFQPINPPTGAYGYSSILNSAYQSDYQTQLYFDHYLGNVLKRNNKAGTWQEWNMLLDTANASSHVVDLTSNQTISGEKTFSNLKVNNTNLVTNLNANMVGGYISSVLLTCESGYGVDVNAPHRNKESGPLLYKISSNCTNIPSGCTDGVLVHFNSQGTDTAFQLVSNYVNTGLYYRSGNLHESSSWYLYNRAWKKVAFTSDVPTKISQLTNDSGYLTSTNLTNYVTLNSNLTIIGSKTFSTQLKFTVANGTAPFTVTSKTLVANLNADLLDGRNSSDYIAYKNKSINYTEGWYRIAETSVNVGNNIGIFYIYSSGPGYHTNVILGASISYTSIPTLNLLNMTQYSTMSISKARIVYNNSTYAELKAYLDVYIPLTLTSSDGSAKSIQIFVKFVGHKWSLTPIEAATVENTHTTKEISFAKNTIISDYFLGDLIGSASALTTTRKIWGLNFDGTQNVTGNMNGVGTINNRLLLDGSGNAQVHITGVTANTDYIKLQIDGGSNSNRNLVLLTDGGNVGIGTDSPLYKLHVAGITSTNLLFIGGLSHPMIIGNGSLLSLGAANSNSKASVVLDLNTDSFRRNSTSTAISLGTAAYPWANIYGDTITIKNYKNFINGNISYPNVDDSYKMGTDLGLISFIGDNGNDTGLGITWSFNTTSAHAGIYTKLSGTYGSKMYFATTNAFSHGPKAALEIDHKGNIKALRGEFKGNLTGTSTSSYLLQSEPTPPGYSYCVYYYSGQSKLGDNTGNAKEGSNDYNLWSYPANSTGLVDDIANIMSLRLQWSTSFLHEIFASPNKRFLWHRNIHSGQNREWSRIVEENSNEKWAINISGNAATATNADTLDGEHGSRYTLTLGGPNYVTITVEGDAATYYPVIIKSVSNKYPMLFVNISRGYSETAPDSWNNSTHKGGLTLTLLWNGSRYWDGNGSGQTCYCVYVYESYCTMVGGLGNSTAGKVVWLRGGGAVYHIHAMNGTSVTADVHTSTYTDNAKLSFAPRTTVESYDVRWPGYSYGADKLGSSTIGGTYLPIYLSSGAATAGTSYAKAIKAITRSGTTFTYTCIDGTTGTFTQLDSNTTYPVYFKHITTGFKDAFRTQTKGDANSGNYISAIRCNDVSVEHAPQDSSGIAFGVGDTHGYLYTNYRSAVAYIGGGNANKLNWVKQLAFTSDIPTALKNPNAIKFKNTSGTEVSYDGSTAVDLTEGIYSAKQLTKVLFTSGYDLNTIKTEQVYTHTLTSICNSLLNGPTGRSKGEIRLESVTCGSGNYGFLTLYTRANSNYEIWYRTWNDNTFTSWVKNIHSGNYTDYTVKKDGTGASGTWGINITGNAGSVKGSYTSNGGQQNPNYFGKNKVGFLMMNTTVNNNSSCKDWIIMDCYAGSDVGGAVAFGVNRQSLGAYIMRSASERTSWTESAELLGTHNYNNYALSLSGGTLSGDLTLLNLYVNYMITSSKPSGALYNPWSIHMDNYLWIQSATADGTNAKGKIALSGKGAESLTELFLKADLTKIHNTILFNKLSVPTTSGGSTYGPGSNGQVLKSNGSTVYWANANTSYGYIGTTAVQSSSKAQSLTGIINITASGNIIASGEITAYSDRRLKSNIKPLENRGYIQPMTYIKDNKECIGFIAQDVLEKYPELVNDNSEYLSLNYLQYVAVLQALIIELEKRIKELENGTRKL